jgi:hypothetical protein
MAMLVGAVIGSAYGWLFLQDVGPGIVGGIAVGTLLAMLYPEKTDDILAKVDNALD